MRHVSKHNRSYDQEWHIIGEFTSVINFKYINILRYNHLSTQNFPVQSSLSWVCHNTVCFTLGEFLSMVVGWFVIYNRASNDSVVSAAL